MFCCFVVLPSGMSRIFQGSMGSYDHHLARRRWAGRSEHWKHLSADGTHFPPPPYCIIYSIQDFPCTDVSQCPCDLAPTGRAAAAVRRHSGYADVFSQSRISTHSSSPLRYSGSSRGRAQATASPCLFGAAPMLVTTSRPQSTKLGSFISCLSGPSRAASHARAARPRPRVICHGASARCMQRQPAFLCRACRAVSVLLRPSTELGVAAPCISEQSLSSPLIWLQPHLSHEENCAYSSGFGSLSIFCYC